MFGHLSPRSGRFLTEISIGAIIALPTSIAVAFLETKFHPFLQALIVGFICFWFLASAGVYYYFLVTRIRSSISNARMGRFDPNSDIRTIRNKYHALTLLLVIVDLLFILFFPTTIIGLYGNLGIFLALVLIAAIVWRKGKYARNN